MIRSIPHEGTYRGQNVAILANTAKLAELHINYETCEPYAVAESAKLLDIDPKKACRVVKMM